MARLAPLVRRADAVAAVLPPELLEKLLALAQGKPVLCAVNQRRATGRFRILPDGRREQEFAYVHGGWEQLRAWTSKSGGCEPPSPEKGEHHTKILCDALLLPVPRKGYH